MGLPKVGPDAGASTGASAPPSTAAPGTGAEWVPSAVDPGEEDTGIKGGAVMSTSTSFVKEGNAKNRNDTIFAKIEANDYFVHTTLTIIVINAIWIMVDVEWNHQNLEADDGSLPLEPYSVIVENLFCTYFSIELAIRFIAFKEKRWCIKDAWFVFDGTLVAFMVIETWIMPLLAAMAGGGGSGGGPLGNLSALRLLRLLRLTRMVRLMRAIPEMMTLIKGMIDGIQGVGFILVFLLLVMYVFAILFTSIFASPSKDEPVPDTTSEFYDPCAEAEPGADVYFGSVGSSMMTLFTQGVLADNLPDILTAIKKAPGGAYMLWVFLIFQGISMMTLLNMLMGVLCEVMSATAEEEEKQAQQYNLRQELSTAFELVDVSGDGLVSQTEWAQIKNMGAVRTAFCSLGINEDDMEDKLQQMEDTIFSDHRDGGSTKLGIDRESFFARVLDLKPGAPAKTLDVAMLQMKVNQQDREFKRQLEHIEDIVDPILKESFEVDALGNGADPYTGLDWMEQVPTEMLFQVLQSRLPRDFERLP